MMPQVSTMQTRTQYEDVDYVAVEEAESVGGMSDLARKAMFRDVQAKNRQGENSQDRNHNSGSLCNITETFNCPVTLLMLYSKKRPEAIKTPDSLY